MIGDRFLQTLSFLAVVSTAAETDAPREIVCEGTYSAHLQGVAAAGDFSSFYWSFTRDLIKTDKRGNVIAAVKVPGHHGDLTWHDGRVYVAVNFGAFNQPAGKADSWVYVYDGDSLALLSKHPVPELVHGAGGMACDGKRFIIIGGLPEGVDRNYAYEYDLDLRFVKRHGIESGYTRLGIQTACYQAETWWFGCYGKTLLKTDVQFHLTGKYAADASYGLVPVSGSTFFVARHIPPKWRARLALCETHETEGLREAGPLRRGPGE